MMDSASTNLGISERGDPEQPPKSLEKDSHEAAAAAAEDEELKLPTFTIDDDVIGDDDDDDGDDDYPDIEKQQQKHEQNQNQEPDGIFRRQPGDDDDWGHGGDEYNDYDDDNDGDLGMYEDPYQETPRYSTGGAAADSGNNTSTSTTQQDYSETGDLDDVDIHGTATDGQDTSNIVDSYDPKEENRVLIFLTKYGKALAACTSGLCCSLVLVMFIIAITYEEGEGDAAHNSMYGFSPWGRTMNPDKVPPFQPPPLPIQEICTQQVIASGGQQAFDQCRDICMAGQCCRYDPIAAPEASCQQGHEEECTTYHHFCEHPPRASILEFQPPPVHLREVCTAENVQNDNGISACAEACQGGVCCRYPSNLKDLSCLRGHETECQTYHYYCENPPSGAKQHLQPGGQGSDGNNQRFPFVKAPDNIGEICANDNVSTAMGFEGCLDTCRGGTCCRFDPDTEPHLSCRNEQPYDCPIYDQYCGDSVSPGSQHTLGGTTEQGEKGPTYIETVCSDHSLATVSGFMECKEACSKEECCWNKEAGTCTQEEQISCAHFAHCLAMDASDHMDVAIQATITLICSDDAIQTISGRKDCLLSCAQAACCFEDNVGECPHDQESFCNQYSACEKVMKDGINVPPAPTALQEHCTNVVSGMDNCEKACSHAPCCWGKDGVESCAAEFALCDDYQACSILKEQNNNDADSGTGSSQQVIPAPPSFLKTACDPVKVANIEGAILCLDACASAACCWKTGSLTCLGNAQCEGYAPCSILNDESIGVDENGIPLNSTTGQSSSTAEQIMDSVPEYLGTVCYLASGDQIHGHLCVRECQAAECCWNKQSASPCTSAPNCAGYEICSQMNFTQLLLGPHQEDTQAPAQDYPAHPIAPEETTAPQATATSAPQKANYTQVMIKDACLNHDNSIVNLCEKICTGSDCCFDKEGQIATDSCNGIECHKYNACGVLHDGLSIAEKCSSSHDDVSDCVSVCGEGACCFTTDPEKSCDVVNPGTICSLYEPCSVLYGF